jgi:integrase
MQFLGELRQQGRSVQTHNHHLKSIKAFTRWLIRDRRNPTDPLAHLSRLNVSTARRHDRRALTPDEFSRLIKAARTGGQIEGVSGTDRAMVYLLAAYTGFRRAEIGSLTFQSLDLDGDPPTATVGASFSKRRREDTQVLHPELVKELKGWLATKQPRPK